MAKFFFRSTDELLAALRLCDDPASWSRPTERLELQGEDGQTAWLLATEGAVGGVKPEPFELRSESPELQLQSRGETHLYQVVERRRATTLLQAVPLVRGATEPAAVTIVRVGTPERFVEVARDNLMLGNDRLGYLPLGDGPAVLRVEQQSEFLAAKWSGADELELYQPSPDDPRLYTPRGLVYPLADKLRLLPGDDDDCWLVDRGGEWSHLRGPWHDIYERISISDSNLEVRELAVAGAVPRLRINLRLTPTERSEPPQLWILDPTEREVLARLLREATEQELNHLEIGYLSDPSGGVSLVIAERHGSVVRLSPPLHGGRPFIARLPAELLYLPSGTTLQPLLSRRSLIEALGLDETHLTVVERAEGNGLKVLRVPREAMRPLLDVVDYLAGEAADDVEAVLDRVVFDFGLDGDQASEATEPGWWQRCLVRLGLAPPR